MAQKNPKTLQLIKEAIEILKLVGIPVQEKSARGLEKMAMAFLAVAGISKSWKEAKGQKDNRHIKTRDIITFINENFEEKISLGSYDDIRRKDLKLLVLAKLILNSADNPSAAQNDPTRGYTLDNEFKDLIILFGKQDWELNLKLFNKNRPQISEILEANRIIPKIKVTLPSGITLDFSKGKHNQLQKEIIDEFLPRFGFGAEVLYVGDASKKLLFVQKDKLKQIGFFEINHDLLPDIVAYNRERNWLFLIEAYHSSGPMSAERIFELKQALLNCAADLIFVTAFISKSTFKKYVNLIGWESEVWTADAPDHLIHFNGDKFLGPHKKNTELAN